jgi:hypothetical protein
MFNIMLKVYSFTINTYPHLMVLYYLKNRTCIADETGGGYAAVHNLQKTTRKEVTIYKSIIVIL